MKAPKALNPSAAGQPRKLSRRSLLMWAGVGAVGAPLLAACGGNDGGGGGGGGPAEGVDSIELGADLDGPVYKDGYIGPRAREYSAFGDGETVFKVVVPQD